MAGRQIKWADGPAFIEQVRSVSVVDPDTGCWLWNHGRFDRSSREFAYAEVMCKGRRESVPRRVLRIVTGQVGEVARHKCDVPPCNNPDHLLWGTTAQNVADRVARGRTNRVPKHPKQPVVKKGLAIGERHGLARLTEQEVVAIRESHANGQTGYALAKQYGVTKRTIQQIVRRETWTHL